MIRIASVAFRTSQTLYDFDAKNLQLACGDEVIVETKRGIELGRVRGCVKEVKEADNQRELKPIIRKANDYDLDKYSHVIAGKQYAIRQCKDLVTEHELDMKILDLDYTFDNAKMIFYFTAADRIDFRELVKDLGSLFKRRIELRQVGARDEARLIGDIGVCGRELCCGQFLSNFQPVSIKMAKLQGLSLNPAKISGICGRLMCCLKYENSTYRDAAKGMPAVGSTVETSKGMARVLEVNVLEGRLKLAVVETEEIFYLTKEELFKQKGGVPIVVDEDYDDFEDIALFDVEASLSDTGDLSLDEDVLSENSDNNTPKNNTLKNKKRNNRNKTRKKYKKPAKPSE